MKRWKRIQQKPFGLVVTEVDENGNYTQSICWAAESITTFSTAIWEYDWQSVEDFLRLHPEFEEVDA